MTKAINYGSSGWMPCWHTVRQRFIHLSLYHRPSFIISLNDDVVLFSFLSSIFPFPLHTCAVGLTFVVKCFDHKSIHKVSIQNPAIMFSMCGPKRKWIFNP